jgi:hypothetical protein
MRFTVPAAAVAATLTISLTGCGGGGGGSFGGFGGGFGGTMGTRPPPPSLVGRGTGAWHGRAFVNISPPPVSLGLMRLSINADGTFSGTIQDESTGEEGVLSGTLTPVPTGANGLQLQSDFDPDKPASQFNGALLVFPARTLKVNGEFVLGRHLETEELSGGFSIPPSPGLGSTIGYFKLIRQ